MRNVSDTCVTPSVDTVTAVENHDTTAALFIEFLQQKFKKFIRVGTMVLIGHISQECMQFDLYFTF